MEHVMFCNSSNINIRRVTPLDYPTYSVTPAVPDSPGASFLLTPAKSFLISAIARPGFRPFGQVLVQFIIVWQRYTENGSRSLSNLSLVFSSLESIIHLYACMRTAGPKYLSPFHQYDGHAVEQHAHKIHSYRPSNFARSSVACKFWSSPLASLKTKKSIISY